MKSFESMSEAYCVAMQGPMSFGQRQRYWQAGVVKVTTILLPWVVKFPRETPRVN